MNNINQDIATTAMCIWEDIFTRIFAESPEVPYVGMYQSVGACDMREFALRVLAPLAEATWKPISNDYNLPFDWEFVPRFLTLVGPKIDTLESNPLKDEEIESLAKKLLEQV